MKISIRSKLVLAISTLILVVFALAAWFFINEKKTEIAEDIYSNSLAFGRITASDVIYFYDLYLAENGFVFFNREVREILEKNDDVKGLSVVDYNGQIYYDSLTDKDKSASGERKVSAEVLQELKSENVAIKTVDGRIFYLKPDGSFVDALEQTVERFEVGTLIDYFIVPTDERFSVIYSLDYHNLDERVAIMMERIIYLALFGVMLGILLSLFMSAQITKPVLQLVGGAENISRGDFKSRVDIKTQDEIGYLGEAFNKMASDLEASMEAKVYQERVTRELELAAEIQDLLIPDDDQIPKVADLDISARLVPAEEIGGDIYDFLKVNDERLLMYLGDVTGHGVPAGIVSSIASALFFGYGFQEDLQKVMIDVNRVLKAKTMPTMFLTLCLLEWNARLKTLNYVSAGHEQLIHYVAAEKKAVLKPAGGIALGMLPDVSKHIKLESVDLQPGDFVVVYSDGIPESWRNDDEIFGIERLVACATEAGQTLKTAAEIEEKILKDTKDFAAGYKQMDDITIMVVKRV